MWRAAYINAVFLGLTGLLFLFFSHTIVGFFTQEARVLAYGTDALHIVAYGFVFYAFGMVLESAFNGAGDTWTPTGLNLVIFWMFEIPLAYLLAYRFHMGPDGVFWAITVAFSALAIVSGYTAINAVVKAELFPAHLRALGVALPYAIANALFGGTAEYAALWFKDAGIERAFYWYVAAMIGLSLIVYLRMRDTRDHSLIHED